MEPYPATCSNPDCRRPWPEGQSGCPYCGSTHRQVAISIETDQATRPALVGHKPSSATPEVIFTEDPIRAVRAEGHAGNQTTVYPQPAQAQATAHDPTGVAESSGPHAETIRTVNTTRETQSTTVPERATLELRGPTPKNEEGGLQACHILRQHLNSRGADLSEFSDVGNAAGATRHDARGDSDVDAVADRLDESGAVIGRVEVQVTRPMSARSFAALARTQPVDGTVEDFARDIFDAICAKARKTSPDRRIEITLVLDATTATHTVMYGVRSAFDQLHRSDVAAAGFQAIWLVGPTSKLCFRLDDLPEP